MIYVPMCWSQLILWQLGQWLMVADSAWSTLQSSAEFCAQIFGAWGTSWRAFHRRVSDRSFDLSLSFRMVDESILYILSSLFLVRNSWKVWKTSKFHLLFQMFSNNWWKRHLLSRTRLRRTNRRRVPGFQFYGLWRSGSGEEKGGAIAGFKMSERFCLQFLIEGYLGYVWICWDDDCQMMWANLGKSSWVTFANDPDLNGGRWEFKNPDVLIYIGELMFHVHHFCGIWDYPEWQEHL